MVPKTDDLAGAPIPRGSCVGWREGPFAILALGFLVLTLPLALAGPGSHDFDESTYHLPAVRQIAPDWPALDLHGDAFSAVSPGYHWALAGVAKLTGTGTRTLRVVNIAVSLCLVGILYFWVRRRLGPWEAALAVAPFAAGNYVVKCAAWVFTDNAALLFTTLALTVALGARPAATVVGVGAGTVATFFRQNSAWLVGPLLWRAVRPQGGRIAGPTFGDPKTWLNVLACGAPLAVVAILYSAWGGLVPPAWAQASHGLTTSGVAYALTLFGLFGVFYLVGLPLPMGCRVNAGALRGVALIGLLAALATPTSYAKPVGRWGGHLWHVALHLPAPVDRSVLFLVGAPIGAIVLYLLWRRIREAGLRPEADLWVVAVLCWLASSVPNRQVFQRYFEPTVFVFLILAIGLGSGLTTPRRYQASIILLVVVQLAITIATTHVRTLF